MASQGYPAHISKPTDQETQSPIWIDFPHHQIHEGDHFVYFANHTLASGSGYLYKFTTPNTTKYAHVIIEARGSGEGSVAMYENAVTSQASYNAITPINRNRNSSNASGVTLVGSVFTTTTGTNIYRRDFGSGQNTGGVIRSDNEYVLKQNTSYMIILASKAAANDMFLEIDWYEHSASEPMH